MVPLEEIFCVFDDFCKLFEQDLKSKVLPNPNRRRNRQCALSISELMTIMVMFHMSHYRTFKDFYKNCLSIRFKKEFPNLLSYTRLVELIPLTVQPLYILALSLTGKQTGKYYVDSTKLQVCDNLRIRSHKVFKDIAKRGKSSTGWFFGFKLHLIINSQGELMSFRLTAGNVDDRSTVVKMCEKLKGWLFGDKGYLSGKLTETLQNMGIKLITKVKKNMKIQHLTKTQKAWLGKRGIVETVIDQLKALLHIQHTRHRSPTNFLANLFAGLLAYIFKPKKPAISFANHITGQIALMSN